jgi:hypothetical protein
MRQNRRFPPVYPTIQIRNLTNAPLYVGLKGKTASGFTLAPAGTQVGGEYVDRIRIKGLDLSDRKVYGTLWRLHYVEGKAEVTVVDSSLINTLISVMGTTTTTSSP